GVDSHDTLGQPGQQRAELHEVVQVRGGIPVFKTVLGLPRRVKRFVQGAMYADRRRVSAAHFAPGMGQRPMYAAYVLTITDGQDTQEPNRLGAVPVIADGTQRRGAVAGFTGGLDRCARLPGLASESGQPWPGSPVPGRPGR